MRYNYIILAETERCAARKEGNRKRWRGERTNGITNKFTQIGNREKLHSHANMEVCPHYNNKINVSCNNKTVVYMIKFKYNENLTVAPHAK